MSQALWQGGRLTSSSTSGTSQLTANHAWKYVQIFEVVLKRDLPFPIVSYISGTISISHHHDLDSQAEPLDAQAGA